MYLIKTRVLTSNEDKSIVSNENQAYLISNSGENNMLIEAKSKFELRSWVDCIEYHIKYANDRVKQNINRHIKDIKAESRYTKADSEGLISDGVTAISRINRISMRHSCSVFDGSALVLAPSHVPISLVAPSPVPAVPLVADEQSDPKKSAEQPATTKPTLVVPEAVVELSPKVEDVDHSLNLPRDRSTIEKSAEQSATISVASSDSVVPVAVVELPKALKVDPSHNLTREGSSIEMPLCCTHERTIELLTAQLSIVRKQLLDNGLMPLEFIPLEDINKEIAEILRRLNNEEAYDQDRFDYLLKCLEVNPEYIAEKELERRQLEEKLVPFLRESLQTMRGFIPPNMQEMKLDELVATHGYSKALAKRIFDKKCLWLTRVDPVSVSKMHISDLSGKFSPLAQNLDVVELAAVYAALPEKFQAEDKVKFKIDIFEQLKKMHAELVSKKLPKIKCRNTVYKDQTPKFDHCNALA